MAPIRSAWGEEKQPRVSTTDPDLPVMKMGEGGFRPAVNVQCATDTQTQIIVGWDVNLNGRDRGLMVPMLDQLEQGSRLDQDMHRGADTSSGS